VSCSPSVEEEVKCHRRDRGVWSFTPFVFLGLMRKDITAPSTYYKMSIRPASPKLSKAARIARSPKALIGQTSASGQADDSYMPFLGVKKLYKHAIKTRPVVTGFIISAVLGGLGDVMAQLNSDKLFHVNKFIGFTFYCGIYNGPVLHFWFLFLSKLFQSYSPTTGLLYKQLLHHGVLNPIVYVPTFYLAQGRWLGLSPEETMISLRTNYVPTLQATWMVFIPVNTVQFLYIPIEHQVLFASACTFFWNIFMAL
jgi:protein Mpv17